MPLTDSSPPGRGYRPASLVPPDWLGSVCGQTAGTPWPRRDEPREKRAENRPSVLLEHRVTVRRPASSRRRRRVRDEPAPTPLATAWCRSVLRDRALLEEGGIESVPRTRDRGRRPERGDAAHGVVGARGSLRARAPCSRRLLSTPISQRSARVGLNLRRDSSGRHPSGRRGGRESSRLRRSTRHLYAHSRAKRTVTARPDVPSVRREGNPASRRGGPAVRC